MKGGLAAFGAGALLAFGWGCSLIVPTVTDTPMPKEAAAPLPASSATMTASLWRDEGMLARLYADNRASRVGDIVTISIVENAQGSKSATTSTAKDNSFTSSIAGTFSNFFGLPARILSLFSPSADLKVTGSDKYDGSGATTRNDQLTATMTAVVTEVFPNGNLKIQGRREVVINSERQTMEVTGIVRPVDVDNKNVIQSTAIADAKISYSGFGVVDDKQHPGLGTRVLNWLSVF